jgi:hypothetical protein
MHITPHVKTWDVKRNRTPFASFTHADSQPFRIQTPLIFHFPASKRAFGAGLRPATPASPGSGGFAAAKRAERGKFLPLNL